MSLRNQKKLLVDQLDAKLRPLREIDKVPTPYHGWINSIRKSLNMTLEQLGKKLSMTKQGVKSMEERETLGSVSIKTLRQAGEAMGMDLVYGFVPIHGSLEKFVEIKARELARKIVLRTNQNMRLENQGNSEERINKAIDELANEIKLEMRRSLWD